ncbi:isopentenyl-diphosphate delta isomerase, putative [Ricinus communis]|uniref:isopentenyl-diphosphate Delta-isomerase n=1 Tax=Ricinus communis TaxID=3988 RepID=B9RM79_RICCO|nr:isopentenyl-diphosphate delta isomerase, putative [Ricinus communis]|eukprot:XP_002514848.1 isopentenyl-diphosphate Delta-isomerase I [Ricinus communis]
MSLTSRLLNTPATTRLSSSLSSSSSSSSPSPSPKRYFLHSNITPPSLLRFPLILKLSSSPFSRVFSSSRSTTASISSNSTMGDAPDAGMDAVQRRLMFEDECILVDESDTVVGHVSKYSCHLWENILKGNSLHRAFSVFLFNSKYELLLQQRSATKVTFPLVWTNTCCSHPLYRESELIEEDSLGVRNAAQRKLLDELGIPAEDVPVDQFTPVGRMLYKAPSDGKWGEHELDYLLFMVRDVNVNPNPDEVADVKYVNRDQLKELLRKADAGEEGLKLSPWFRLVVDNFLFKWWEHAEKGTLKEATDMKTIHKLT